MGSVPRDCFRNLVSEMYPVYYIADFCHEPLVLPLALHVITLKLVPSHDDSCFFVCRFCIYNREINSFENEAFQVLGNETE